LSDNITIRNTKQRRYMLQLLQSTKEHPSALWLYERMKPAFPSLSFSTVYRNLGILEQQGQIMRLVGGGSFDRYDADTFPHSHFYCKECGSVYDIDTDHLEELAINSVKDCGHRLDGCHIAFSGVCKSCCKQRKNKKE